MPATKTARLIVGSGEACADILYACGFRAPDAFSYFESGKTRGVAVSSLEFSRAVASLRKDVKAFNRDEFIAEGSVNRDERQVLIGISRKLRVKRWEVPAEFPLRLADALRAEGIEVVACEGEFLPQRRRKSKEEIELIRKAEAVTEESMALAASLLRKAKVSTDKTLTLSGRTLTSELMISEIELFLKGRGFSANSTIVACGPCGSQPHNTGSGPIVAGQPVIVDIFPRDDRTGYWGDMTRTFLKGKAPSPVKRAYEAVKLARDEAKKIIKAGLVAAEPHKLAFDILASKGFKTGRNRDGIPCGFIHGLGHGVGLEIHEAPRVSPANKSPLEEGNVVSVEPGLYYPSWGGIRLEDLVVVRKNGCECLNEFPSELEIP